jgi:hypothetical protein
MQWHKYPKRSAWHRMSTECKERAGWACEECGVAQGEQLISKRTGRPYTNYLQAAHVHSDHDNPNPVLICVCASCHVRLYRKRDRVEQERRKHRILRQRKGYTV